jgi:hypothetical protein
MDAFAVVCRTYVAAPFPTESAALAFLEHVHCVERAYPSDIGRTCGEGWFPTNHKVLPLALSREVLKELDNT